MVQAYILIQTEVGRAGDVAAAIRDIPGVVRVDAVTGPYDVVVLTEAQRRRRAGQDGRQPGAAGARHHPHPDLLGGAPLTHDRSGCPAALRRRRGPATAGRWSRSPIALGDRRVQPVAVRRVRRRRATAPSASPAAAGDQPPVTMAAPALADDAAAVCRAVDRPAADAVRDASRRPVTAGAEQNAAYGDPAAHPRLRRGRRRRSPRPTTCSRWPACAGRRAPAPAGTVWTTVDRAGAGRGHGPRPTGRQPAQSVAPSRARRSPTVAPGAQPDPSGCRADPRAVRLAPCTAPADHAAPVRARAVSAGRCRGAGRCGSGGRPASGTPGRTRPTSAGTSTSG